MLKANRHNIEGFVPLALHKRHGAPCSDPHEADVDPLGGSTSLITEVSAEAFAVVNV